MILADPGRNAPLPLTNVPALTPSFWIIKILTTALGEIAGDSVTMTWLDETTSQAGSGWLSGYLVGTVLARLRSTTSLSRAGLFWAAFMLTRPLGATLGDFLDKPVAKGGLDVSRPVASLIMLLAIMVCFRGVSATGGQGALSSPVLRRL